MATTTRSRPASLAALESPDNDPNAWEKDAYAPMSPDEIGSTSPIWSHFMHTVQDKYPGAQLDPRGMSLHSSLYDDPAWMAKQTQQGGLFSSLRAGNGPLPASLKGLVR